MNECSRLGWMLAGSLGPGYITNAAGTEKKNTGWKVQVRNFENSSPVRECVVSQHVLLAEVLGPESRQADQPAAAPAAACGLAFFFPSLHDGSKPANSGWVGGAFCSLRGASPGAAPQRAGTD